MRNEFRIVVFACALLPVAVSVAAQAMSVETFLTKTRALQAKGLLAATSPDLPLVRDEVKNAASAYRAQIDADKAAGKPPRACPPPVGQAKIDGQTLIAEFEAIPVAKRNVSVKTALCAMMDRRYPCR